MGSVTLPIPAANSTGNAVDVSTLDPEKTFVIGGTFGEQEQIVIEGTCDPLGLVGFNGIAAFNSPTSGFVIAPQTPTSPPQPLTIDQPVMCVVAFMRVRRTSPTTVVSAPTVIVNADNITSKNFASFNVPLTNGVGTSLAVNGFGPIVQFTVEGTFGPNEVITIEGSMDNISFNPIASFSTGKPPLTFLRGRWLFMRVRRSGS